MDAQSTAPFVGLRPFEEESSHLFFGRRNQMNELLARLESTRLVAIVGSSGCGKSSLVRAGLVPALKAGFLVKSRAAWRVLVIKPGKAPIRHLAAAVLRDGGGGEEEPAAAEVAALEQEIRVAGAEAVLERLAGSAEKGDHNVLLVVDQFEEIFRFGLHDRNQKLRDEAADFVSVLLALAEESALPVYVVLTMRADFIRDCDDIPELPDALNRSLFLVPRLTREQFREAIEGPVRWSDGSIANRLLDRLLNDSNREHDELPVLQHALLRTWKDWSKDGQGPMDAEHYEHAGTVESALDLDAEAALEGLDEAGIDRVRRVFQALTAVDDANRKIRRPARLGELEHITGLGREEILPLLERFRADGRSLLVWSDSDPDPLIDISHESLIRNWRRLAAWTEEEAESVDLYRRLARAAADYPDRGGLWRDPKLQIGLDWRERAAPTRTWAERVAPEAEFEGAMRFLDESLRAREEELERRERVHQEAHERELAQERAEHRLRGTRRLLAASGAFLVVMAAITAYAFDQQALAKQKQLWAETLQDQQYLVFEASNELQTYPTHSLLLASGVLSHGLSREGVSDSGAGHLYDAQRLFLQALAHSGGRVAASGTGAFATLAVTPGGRSLVTAQDGKFLVCWALESAGYGEARDEIGRYPLPEVTAMTPAGNRLAVGTGDTDRPEAGVWLLDLGDDGCPGGPGVFFPTGDSDVHSLEADSGGRWLAAVAEGELTLWALDASGGTAGVPSLHALSDGTKVTTAAIGGGSSRPWLAVGLTDGESSWVEVWRLGKNGLEGPPSEWARDSASIEALAASDGSDRLLVARTSAETILFDVSDDSTSSMAGVQLDAQERIVAAEMGSDSERVVTWNSDGGIDLWDLTTGDPHRITSLPPAGRSTVQAGAFSEAGRSLLTAHYLPDARNSLWEVRRWSLTAFDPAEEILVHQLPQAHLKEGIRRVAFSPNRTRALVLDRSGGLSLWSLEASGFSTPDWPWEPDRDGRKARAAAFAGDDSLLVSWRDGSTEALGLGGGVSKSLAQSGSWAPTGSKASFDELTVSRDGRLVMTAEKDQGIHVLRVWDLEKGAKIFEADGELKPPVPAAAFTPDGRRLITAGPREAIRVHDLDGEEPGPVVEDSRNLRNILTLDVSPDGRRLVTGGGDGVVRFWDLPAAGKKVVLDRRLSIEQGGDPVVAVGFTPDGEDVLVTTESGATRRWPVLWEDRYRLARELVGDGPVPTEIRESLHAPTTRQEVFAALLEPEEGPQEPRGDTVALAAEKRDPTGLRRPR